MGSTAPALAGIPSLLVKRLPISSLQRYLTVRDSPLWLASVGLLMMALTGVVQSFGDPSLTPVVVLVMGGTVLTIVLGRVLVRHTRYTRRRRIAVAVLALVSLFPLLGALAFLLLPAALALLAVELVAPPPGSPGPPPGPMRQPSDPRPTG
jgi:chromate transport protein ChrA